MGVISPGCGCDEGRVDEIILELKQRMRHRGDTAQLRQAEQTLMRLELLDAKLNTIMTHLSIPQPLAMEGRAE